MIFRLVFSKDNRDYKIEGWNLLYIFLEMK